ncbi:hypothetical protein [Streptomyces chartreusis]|uniref:hypothetical protein n=1 Tax=Streptomyces chartreusis TaxID=1969 RepID=UPI0037DD36E9|nr:hypothetical protein OG938_48345 [Streptomyces chartreusis]
MSATEPASPRQQIVDALEDYPVACWTPGNLADRALRSIGAELEAGQDAEKRLTAITEAVTLWRDRPGGDIGLAIALAGILDTEQPEPPATKALVNVLRECDRIENAIRANPTAPDSDGAYLACLGHIRKAAGAIPPDPMEDDPERTTT